MKTPFVWCTWHSSDPVVFICGRTSRDYRASFDAVSQKRLSMPNGNCTWGDEETRPVAQTRRWPGVSELREWPAGEARGDAGVLNPPQKKNRKKRRKKNEISILVYEISSSSSSSIAAADRGKKAGRVV
jgi:hypothetical protein